MSKRDTTAWLLVTLACGGSVRAADASTNLVKNGDFEAPSLTASPPPHFNKKATVDLPYYVRPAGKISSWTYTRTRARTGAGILNTTANPNPWYGDASPTGYSGVQYVFLQSADNIYQDFKVEFPRTYKVSWLDAGRPAGGNYDGNQTYQLVVNGAVEGTFQTTSGQNFAQRSVEVTLSEGTNRIAFFGMPPDDKDHTAFLDAVSVSPAR
jgi:hypothetical protein